MLDQNILEQLKGVFAQLESKVTLQYDDSDNENQAELLEMLNGVASTSDKIEAISSGNKSVAPAFRILKNGQATGIHFRGIPGGHEFTSFIIAILNTDGKGKMPEGGVVSRIKAIKGPVRIRTYISLSCENCPDVVQALNQMSLLHGDFQHEMIDGAYAQDEIQKLNIQGVPSVVVDEKMIHSGRIEFLDLLTKVETHFGKDENVIEEKIDLGHYDVAVIGGGPAGASAAIYSARKGLKTLLLAERMGGQVADTQGIENMISVIYTEGPKLVAQLQEHVASYPIKVLTQRRVKTVSKDKKIFLEGGEEVSAESIIIATGAKWRELNVPGEKDYLGRGVAYCPHCDGPFYKGKKVAVIGGGNSGVEAAIDLAGIVKEVVLIEFGESLKADAVLVEKLKSLPNSSIVTHAKTTSVEGDGAKLTALNYEDRQTGEIKKIDLDGVFVQIGLLPNSGFLKETVELSKFGEVVVDGKGRTNVKGIYAAGDVTTAPYKQIVIAMGEGAKVALAAFEDRMYHS
ncbi:MAG: alkyl hydroperoxide reductase subunit F [Bdellovibrionia bacterium]